ncbi:MAG: hypothetical protein ACLPYZ_14055 [Limisphaerales bacterium]
MKDTELQKVVLQTYYDLRHLGRFQWINEDVPEDKWPPVESFGQLARICSQLAEEDLIEWHPLIGANAQPVGGTGQIKARGVRVIEGAEKPPVGFVINNIHNQNSPGANFHLGQGNIQQYWVELASEKIDGATTSAEEKQKAKSLLAQISENKLLNTIIGSAVGELTKAALPK